MIAIFIISLCVIFLLIYCFTPTNRTKAPPHVDHMCSKCRKFYDGPMQCYDITCKCYTFGKTSKKISYC